MRAHDEFGNFTFASQPGLTQPSAGDSFRSTNTCSLESQDRTSYRRCTLHISFFLLSRCLLNNCERYRARAVTRVATNGSWKATDFQADISQLSKANCDSGRTATPKSDQGLTARRKRTSQKTVTGMRGGKVRRAPIILSILNSRRKTLTTACPHYPTNSRHSRSRAVHNDWRETANESVSGKAAARNRDNMVRSHT